MTKVRILVLLSLVFGAAPVALAQETVQLKFSRVVDLTLPIESNMAPIPGLKPYLDNPSRVNVISSITEAQRETLRAEGMTLSSDHAVNGRSMISVLSHRVTWSRKAFRSTKCPSRNSSRRAC
jgi:hypothetical protein